jgi:hypothetical protein
MAKSMGWIRTIWQDNRWDSFCIRKMMKNPTDPIINSMSKLMKFFGKFIPCLGIIVLLGCSRGIGATAQVSGKTAVTVNETVAPPATLNLAAPIETAKPANTPTIPAKKPPAIATINPTYLIFSTFTPTATLDTDTVLLNIISPGPMSKVVSPVDFVVHIAPNYTGTTRIELIGESGTQLYRKIFKTYSNVGYFTRVNEKINFEIQGAAEIARLQISTVDSLGRIQAHNSVRLLLQAVGENGFTSVIDIHDRIILRSPSENEEIKITPLVVSGEIKTINDQPWVLELLDEKGGVVGSRVLKIAPGNGGYQPFTAQIPFKVDKKTPVRLVIHQSDDRIIGLAYLYSRLLLLLP